MQRTLRVACGVFAIGLGGFGLPKAIATPVPVVAYTFNNSTGTTTPSTGSNTAAILSEFDSTGTNPINNNTATGPNGTGDLAYARTVNGSKSVAKYVGDLGASLDSTSAITALFWINGSNVSAGSDRIFVMNGNDGDGTTGTFEVEANSGGSFNIKFGTATQVVTGSTAYTTNAWSFVAVTFDGTKAQGSRVALYSGTQSAFNATPAFPTDTTSPSSLVDPASGAVHQLLVGNRSDGTRGSGFDIDDLRIFDTALSASDIQTFYNTDVPEPASVGLIVLGSIAALVRRRRPV